MRFVGIDRCRNAWLVAQREGSLAQVEYLVEASLRDLLAKFDPDSTLVVIDVPIGLPDSQPRAVDLAARRLLGSPRASSVFPVPMRSALSGQTYEEASALNHAACGKKLPVQAFGMLDGIRELDRFMTSERQGWVREGHPEVTFAMLSGGARGLTPSKKSTEGEEMRLALLGRYLPAPAIDGLRHQLGRGRVARDDVVDVLAMLVSAFRLHEGTTTVLPEVGPELDSRGLRMEMVAWVVPARLDAPGSGGGCVASSPLAASGLLPKILPLIWISIGVQTRTARYPWCSLQGSGQRPSEAPGLNLT